MAQSLRESRLIDKDKVNKIERERLGIIKLVKYGK